jgi:hypothetical protein
MWSLVLTIKLVVDVSGAPPNFYSDLVVLRNGLDGWTMSITVRHGTRRVTKSWWRATNFFFLPNWLSMSIVAVQQVVWQKVGGAPPIFFFAKVVVLRNGWMDEWMDGWMDGSTMSIVAVWQKVGGAPPIFFLSSWLSSGMDGWMDRQCQSLPCDKKCDKKLVARHQFFFFAKLVVLRNGWMDGSTMSIVAMRQEVWQKVGGAPPIFFFAKVVVLRNGWMDGWMDGWTMSIKCDKKLVARHHLFFSLWFSSR